MTTAPAQSLQAETTTSGGVGGFQSGVLGTISARDLLVQGKKRPRDYADRFHRTLKAALGQPEDLVGEAAGRPVSPLTRTPFFDSLDRIHDDVIAGGPFERYSNGGCICHPSPINNTEKAERLGYTLIKTLPPNLTYKKKYSRARAYARNGRAVVVVQGFGIAPDAIYELPAAYQKLRQDESQIAEALMRGMVFEIDGHYVKDLGSEYAVFTPSGTHATSTTAFDHTDDGLSLAVYSCVAAAYTKANRKPPRAREVIPLVMPKIAKGKTVVMDLEMNVVLESGRPVHMNSPTIVRIMAALTSLGVSEGHTGWEGMDGAAQDLRLYINNEPSLHSKNTSIIRNMMVKLGQGKYDRKAAIQGFMYLVEEGAKKYATDNGGQVWHKQFSMAQRQAVSASLRDFFEEEAALGNYSNYLPLKYNDLDVKAALKNAGAPV